MMLDAQQIERYSRQIIVPRVGGRAQERLLGARATLIGEAADIEAALAYLAGAGVGQIAIYPVGQPESYRRMVEHTRGLNPEVVATAGAVTDAPVPDLILALVGNARALASAASVLRENSATSTVIARLDAPARVAVLPAPPPCALCADADLWSAPGERGANGGVAAMLAVVEAFKLLAGFDERPAPRVFEFADYCAAPHVLSRRAGDVRCGCELR